MVANHPEKKHALFLLMETCLKKMQTRLKKLVDVTRRPSRYGALDVSLSLFWGGIYVSFEKYC